MIWFNLSFSMKVKTNLGKKFLKRHPMHKFFNRTVKTSYSFMRNMKPGISSHKKKQF